MVLQEQTLQQFLARLVGAWREAEGVRAALLARFILVRLASGDIDKGDYKAAFGMNERAWDAFVERLQELLEAYALVEDAKGTTYAGN